MNYVEKQHIRQQALAYFAALPPPYCDIAIEPDHVLEGDGAVQIVLQVVDDDVFQVLRLEHGPKLERSLRDGEGIDVKVICVPLLNGV